MQIDLLIDNGYVLTMDGDFRLFERGSVAIKDGRIVAVGDSEEIRSRVQADRVIDASNKAILPGLIDSHGHAGHAGKVLGHHLDGRGWRNVVDHVNLRSTDEGFWYADGLLSALERLRAGTTTALCLMGSSPRADRPEPAERYVEGIAEVGVRTAIAVGPARPPWPKTYSWWDQSGRSDYEVTLEMIEKVVRTLVDRKQGYAGLIDIWAGASRFLAPSPLDPTYRPEQLDDAAAQAAMLHRLVSECGLRLHTHAYAGVIDYVARNFADYALLGDHVCLAHCQGISSEELEILADTGTSMSYNPAATRTYLYSEKTPVVDAIDKGVVVGIGSDGCSRVSTFDLFGKMHLATVLQRYGTGEQSILPPGKVLAMVTIDAAKALGMANEIGSLEVGKRADVITVRLDVAHLTPATMIPYRLVYHATGADVSDVVVGGELLMANSDVLSVDEGRVIAMANEETERAIERSGLSMLLGQPQGFWTKSSV